MLKVRRYLDWNFNMEEAPRDKLVLLDVGMPWPVIGIWSSYYEAFVFPNLQMCKVQEIKDEEPWDDIYFENETEKKPRAFAILPDPLPSVFWLDRMYAKVFKEGTYNSFREFWSGVGIHLEDLNIDNFKDLGKRFDKNFKKYNKRLGLKVENIKSEQDSVIILCSTVSTDCRKLVMFYTENSKTNLSFSGEFDEDNIAIIVETLAEWLYYLVDK